MTTKTKAPTTKEILKAIADENITDAKRARGFLSFRFGLEGKDATEILAEAGFSTRTKGEGVGLNEVLKWLEEAPRTEKELYTYILESGTKNEKRWVSQRNSIRAVVFSVYKKGDDTLTDVSASAELKKAVKDAI